MSSLSRISILKGSAWSWPRSGSVGGFVKVGLATIGTATVLSFVLNHFWSKYAEKERKKKFLFGPIPEEGDQDDEQELGQDDEDFLENEEETPSPSHKEDESVIVVESAAQRRETSQENGEEVKNSEAEEQLQPDDKGLRLWSDELEQQESEETRESLATTSEKPLENSTEPVLDSKSEQQQQQHGDPDNPEENALTFQPTHEKKFKFKITVPQQHTAGLVGKAGSNIRRIEKETNTNITNQRTNEAEDEDQPTVFFIHGTSENFRRAEEEIMKYVTTQNKTVTVPVEVPSVAVGKIMGQHGVTIRKIQDKSKTKITKLENGDINLAFVDEPSSTRQTTLLVSGSEEGVQIAKELIAEEVEADRQNRAKKLTAKAKAGPLAFPASCQNGVASDSTATATAELEQFSTTAFYYPLKIGKALDVYVSSAKNPNDFWIQVVGVKVFELERLTRTMTEFYKDSAPAFRSGSSTASGRKKKRKFRVGDLVAAPYDKDDFTYRGKVLELNGPKAKVLYVDFGDERELEISALQHLNQEHLKLRFQAVEATLNLEHEGEWSAQIWNDFCDLTHCAEWKQIRAKVIDVLRPGPNRTVICLQLFDKNGLNIGDEILRRVAASKSSPPILVRNSE